jgi:hypothetical protein
MPALRVAGLVAGVAAAATLGGGAAAGATATASVSHTTAQVPACATSQLHIWYGVPDGVAMGNSFIPFEFSNIGTTTCSLYGFPGVSAIAANGRQLDSPAAWEGVIAPRAVVLTPGATAHVVLDILTVENYPTDTCEPTKADALRFYPPNQKTYIDMPFDFEACAKSGPKSLSVDPVNAGAGIPQYTNS